MHNTHGIHLEKEYVCLFPCMLIKSEKLERKDSNTKHVFCCFFDQSGWAYGALMGCLDYKLLGWGHQVSQGLMVWFLL